MTSPWKTLGVTFNASETEIRQAYLRLARQCHPDKNPNDPKATKTFQKLQDAYEVLRNGHFLDRGSSDTTPETQETTPKRMPTFVCRPQVTVNLSINRSSKSYSGHPDSNAKFYSVFQKLFREISFWEMKCKQNTSKLPPPSFERSSTPLKDVKTFYKYWAEFSTKMYVRPKGTHNWVLISTKPPSKTSVKSVQQHREQFNTEVRSLVNFLLKQDERLNQK
ncbi:dnaJ homolog subfamily C member 21-like [Homarus americanus]|uniref:DnaJ subfamily C member 21-like 6 n=1 Tax=Homarus americanus TaxID=6706 RepID=A0A8J5K0U3_HOMAM|nr:dnaJ homolog subfamily C member 21-like [Homarus americanus]KAG7168077.1 DnaJ subfamily C member 21-like 6 [Homarus americanus]